MSRVKTQEAPAYPEPPSKRHNELAIELVAGSVGGALQVLVGQPLDTLKVRAQTAPKGQFKNTLDILSQTVKNEGPLALYKGMLSPLLGIALVNSLLFTSYGSARRLISPYPELTLPQTALAGGMAGAANAVLASPVEMFKIRMQGQYGRGKGRGLGAVIGDVWRAAGWRGIMRGYWVTFVREIPAYAAFYTAYTYAKARLSGVPLPTAESIRASASARLPSSSTDSRAQPQQQPPITTLLLAGASGGVAYWLACYPLDVIKSRMQLSDAPLGRGLGYIARTGADVVRTGGVQALFKGIAPSVIRAVPAAAATFVGFELSKEYITVNNLL